MRLVERRLIGDRVFIEDHEVSREAFANQTPIAKPNVCAGSEVIFLIASSSVINFNSRT